MMPRTSPIVLVQANNGLHDRRLLSSAVGPKRSRIGCSPRTSDTLPAWAIGQPRRTSPAHRETTASARMTGKGPTRDGDLGEHPETGVGSASMSGARS